MRSEVNLDVNLDDVNNIDSDGIGFLFDKQVDDEDETKVYEVPMVKRDEEKPFKLNGGSALIALVILIFAFTCLTVGVGYVGYVIYNFIFRGE